MQGEPLCDYIWRFSQKCHELPSVADADIASAFWDGIMCHSLVHELSREQPKTTKELLNIATRHASGEEAVGANFTLAKEGVAIGGGQTAPPPNVTVRGTKKGEKKGQKRHSRCLAAMANNDNVEEIKNSDEEFVVVAERDFKWRTGPTKDHFEKILEAA
jgi:hypothetical protein